MRWQIQLTLISTQATNENQHCCQVVVVGGGRGTPSEEVVESAAHHINHSNTPLRSSLTITLSSNMSPPLANHRPSTSPDGNDVTDHPVRQRDDVMRHVLHVELDKTVAGLGFCIDGGRKSLTGDQPITVKRIFRCMYVCIDGVQLFSSSLFCFRLFNLSFAFLDVYWLQISSLSSLVRSAPPITTFRHT